MHRQFGDSFECMSTKHRFRDKYRIELRERDHLPPHMHLTGGGVDVVISLESVAVTQGKGGQSGARGPSMRPIC